LEGQGWVGGGLQDNDIQLKFSPWAEIYPQYFSKLEYLIDRLKLLNFRCELLPEALVNQISEKVDGLLASYNEAFASLIQARYIHWVTGSRKSEGAKNIPLLVTDFLDVLFMPFYEEYIRTPAQSAFIILFDGMRWDGWNAIKTRMLQTFWGKLALEKTVPLLSTLPTTTEFSRRALISGLFPNESITLPSLRCAQGQASDVIDKSDLSPQSRDGVDNWWKLLSLAFAKRQICEVQAITVHEQNLNQLVQLIEDSEVKVKVINFTLFDHKLHNSKQNLSTLYEEVLINFDDIIQPCLERIPSDSLVFILSDHGLIEIKGKAQTILSANTEGNKRYFGLKNSLQYSDMFTSFSSLPSVNRFASLSSLASLNRFTSFSNLRGKLPANIVFFDSDDIKMPRSSGIVQYGFATSNTHLITKDTSTSKGYLENQGETFASWFTTVNPSSQPGRYAHGGISMQEMIVPCSIFVPKGEGQLELWQNGKTARGQDGKGLKGS
jgi:hypothetical protein